MRERGRAAKQQEASPAKRQAKMLAEKKGGKKTAATSQTPGMGAPPRPSQVPSPHGRETASGAKKKKHEGGRPPSPTFGGSHGLRTAAAAAAAAAGGEGVTCVNDAAVSAQTTTPARERAGRVPAPLRRPSLRNYSSTTLFLNCSLQALRVVFEDEFDRASSCQGQYCFVEGLSLVG